MKTTRSTLIKSIAATFAALMLTACGSDSGGGGGGGSTGTSSISLTDAPIDEALDVTVRFDGVEFQPADGDRFMLYLADTTGTCEVVDVQDSANPCEVNLLDYQGVDRITIVDRATMPAVVRLQGLRARGRWVRRRLGRRGRPMLCTRLEC